MTAPSSRTHRRSLPHLPPTTSLPPNTLLSTHHPHRLHHPRTPSPTPPKERQKPTLAKKYATLAAPGRKRMCRRFAAAPYLSCEKIMSKPVPYLPDEVRHDIRNTKDGEFLFVPTELMCQAFQFILATAARRYNVGIVAYALMCSHIHLLVVDLGEAGQTSDVPGFRRFVRSTFGQFVRWYWNREIGRIFCPDSVGKSINVLDFQSVEEAIVYIETNPTAAGMEKTPELMKGAVSLRKWLVQPKYVERPPVYFQRRTWEESERLELVVPPTARAKGFTSATFYERTKRAVDARVKSIDKMRRKEGRRAKPLHVIRRLRPEDGKGKSAGDHKEILVACKDPIRSSAEFSKIRAFRRAHALALHRLRNGDRDVVFPPGTYLAAKRYGVRVAVCGPGAPPKLE